MIAALNIMSMFYHIETDVTFCLHDAEPNYIYNRHIDRKISRDVFTNMFLESTYDKNVLMLDKNKNIKKCIYEKQNTYIDYYYDNFSYNKNMNALYHIYHNFSMYHNVNSELYNGLWNNVNFIIKCSYLRENPYSFLYLPRELHTIILRFMIQSYQQNDVKNFDTKETTDYLFHHFINLD